MAIAAGTKLGTYEVTSHIGSGGMGEVYQAHDSKLSRDVAIKVLPEQFARDPERLARFQREAKLLAALNHPNIAIIHGLEQSGSTHYLVMELVPGETLRDRIVRDGALAVEEALKIAKQIAEALEAAHEKSIIHRDLKPANVKITPEGRVKVLDFGLAKAFSTEPSSADVANSPTLTMNPTIQGVILGTAAYMSPEQAKGRSLNRATDIFAFGAVLYEMLTGKQCFSGEDVGDILATVVKSDPDWSSVPARTPPSIKTLLRRCLRKDRQQRLQDAATLRIEIEDALSGTAAAESVATSNAQAMSTAKSQVFSWAASFALGLIVATIAVSFWKPSGTQPSPTVTRLNASLPSGDHIPLLNTNVVAISPDGTQMAFASIHEGKQQIYLRPFASEEAKALAGTDGAESLFFSPDGQWLGFFAAGRLMKASLQGGAPLPICDAANPRGVTWGDNGKIILANNFGADGLSQVSASGGKPQRLTAKDPTTAEEAHRWPQLLPGSRAVLFTGWSRNLDDSFIAVLRLDTNERRILIQGGTDARYLPSGHLVYARSGNLLAVPFDADKLQVTGDPIPVGEGAGVSLSYEGNAQFSVSKSGSLVFIPGGLQSSNRTLVWVDRSGHEQSLAVPPGNYLTPSLSPDGQRIAVVISGAEDDIWIYDIARQAMSRFTSGARSLNPIWTPDGKRIIYRSTRAGVINLFWKPADASSPEERLTTSQTNQTPISVSPDGQLLLFRDAAKGEVLMLPLNSPDRKPQLLIETTANNGFGVTFAPDGNWIAYTSAESGRNEVYVRPFPSGPVKLQVSTNGGSVPVWGPRGEIFYLEADKMMVAQVITRPTLTAGKPHELFEFPFVLLGTNHNSLSVDGRFLLLKAGVQEQTASQIHVILNWAEELNRRVPTGKK